MIIRTYDIDQDAVWLHGLWHRTLGPQWAILHDDLQQRLHTATIRLVAVTDGQPIAFCAASHRPSLAAGLLFIAVEPDEQRRGIGGALLEEVLRRLSEAGCSSCFLGTAGEANYFWPGVPKGECSAWPFFSKHGWKENDQICDLSRDLAGYEAPAWVASRAAAHGVTLLLAAAAFRERILDFESNTFPAWSAFFEGALDKEDYDNILVALDDKETVVGTVLLNSDELLTWRQSLGAHCGSFGVLGVREDQRVKGIGLALADKAMALLQERGCQKCYIHWTGLTQWYGKLGTEVWADYRTSDKRLL